MKTRRCVLVGGGVAAASAAAHLRKRGFDGDVVLAGEEVVAPYERPPLSKEFLTGPPELVQPLAPDWYAANGVELRLGVRAVDLDVAGRSIGLSTGERLGYDDLVLATGARPRRLPGFDGEGIHYLRTAADSGRLRAELATARRIVILGAGFIGCEVAASAITLGTRVTLFEPEPAPLARVLGPAIGAVLMGIHRERGVEIRAGEYVTAVERGRHGFVLTTSRGDRVEADLVVVGVGSVPNVELGQDAGLAVANGGIAVDEYGRTSAPHVYAAGDVAAQHHPRYGTRIRVEHHDTAVRQGANVAANLTGEVTPFEEAHWFWSDQYEHSLQSTGRMGDFGSAVLRGSLAERSFSAFSLVDGRIQGVISLNRPGDVLAVRRMLFAPHEVTAAQLADESLPLKRLLPRTKAAPRAGAR
jgi:3-phenylpropionate/trans-cinnamate dioxygenase ferredoxin reductase subunit